MTRSERLASLLALSAEERRRALARFTDLEREELATHWDLWARAEQLAPPGDWRLWLVMAGRGFGKTRAGAEWVRAVASADPQARIALVAASLVEARAVMVEGESGLLAISPPRRRPVFEPSLRRVTWPNGAQATLYSAGEPESLRGPQHSHACRAVPEGSIRQRSTFPARHADSLRDRGRGNLSANPAGRRRNVDGRQRRRWRLAGA